MTLKIATRVGFSGSRHFPNPFTISTLLVAFLIATMSGINFSSQENQSDKLLTEYAPRDLTQIFFVAVVAIVIFDILIHSKLSTLLEAIRANWLFFLTLLLFSFSAAYNEIQSFPVSRLILQFILILSLFYMVHRIGDVQQVLNCFYYSCLIILAFCYIAVLAGFGVHHFEYPGAWRGIFPHKNIAGGTIAICLVSFIAGSANKSRFVNFASIACSLLFLVMSESKTALLLIVPSMSFGIILAKLLKSEASRSLFKLVVILNVMLTVAFPVYIFQLATLFDQRWDFTGRDVIWELAFRIGSLRPMLGWGYESFFGPYGSYDYFSSARTLFMRAVSHAHNGFLNIFVQGGLLTLVAAVFAISIPILMTRYRYFRSSEKIRYLFGLWNLLLWRNIFESDFFIGYRAPWIALLLLLSCFSMANLKAKKSELKKEFRQTKLGELELTPQVGLKI